MERWLAAAGKAATRGGRSAGKALRWGSEAGFEALRRGSAIGAKKADVWRRTAQKVVGAYARWSAAALGKGRGAAWRGLGKAWTEGSLGNRSTLRQLSERLQARLDSWRQRWGAGKGAAQEGPRWLKMMGRGALTAAALVL